MAITYARDMNFRPSGPIPGAFEPRRGQSAVRPTISTAVPLTPHATDASVPNRDRLERQREGGGAPSERLGVGHQTIFGRLFDFLVR